MAKRRKQRFEVTIISKVILTLDESLTPDDEWRSQFYPLHSLKDVAGHVAFNVVANGAQRINQLDGFADRKEGDCVIARGETFVDQVERQTPTP